MSENGGAGMDDERGVGSGAGADVLEARHRLILMLLPAGYREQRGEEMISTLLDGATEGRRWPSIGEVASLAALATRLRVGAPGGTRRAVAIGEVLRRTALTGLLALGIWEGANCVVNVTELFSVHGHWYFEFVIRSTWAGPLTAHLVQPFVYFGAFVALVLGRRRWGRVLAVAQVAAMAVGVIAGSYAATSDEAAQVAAAAVVALAAGLGFHREAPPLPMPGRWMIAAALTSGPVLILITVVSVLDIGSLSEGLDSVARVVLGPLLRARRSPIWPAALLTLGLPGLVMLPRTIILDLQGKEESLSFGEIFAGFPGLDLATYMTIIDAIFAVALAWALYRSRARSTAIAT